MDESRTPGWYKGPITQGSEPKPVCNGTTMHTVCVIDSPLATYKLHAWTFGGKTDEDLQHCHINIVTMQKWVNLMSITLDNFKGKGHCITMDFAYMEDIMAQIGCKELQLNIVDTSQSNRVGTDIKDTVNKMKVGRYKSKIWEHNSKNLMVVVWANNPTVKRLSNYHGATIIKAENGLMQRAKDKSRIWALHQKAVLCPAQTKDYCQTFHLIDKGNGNEAKYNMARKSWLHNWAPKLVFRLFNIGKNNAYIVYKELVMREGRKSLSMGQAVRE